MESGEKELRKAFEDVTTNNVKSAVAHCNETRRLFRELETKIVSLSGLVQQQQNEIVRLKNLLVDIQTIVFRGGTNGA
jgi:hypothetical protein